MASDRHYSGEATSVFIPGGTSIVASAPAAPPSPAPVPAPRSSRGRSTLYRGTEGMWSWVLHRITGVGLFLFLLVHVLDTAIVRVSPEVYNDVIGTYKTPIMGVMEAGLVAAVIFHAFNGIRIILVDFLAKGPRYQRVMFWVVIGLTVVLMAGFLPRHLGNVFGGGH
ncbi:MAG TPA: succinate dehydrogenase, cytochrome b556 subunit [Micrococcales bacterium]|nr:succinate dehydrogenase, cytochrome b556 subunit [Micrococcales bacterium]